MQICDHTSVGILIYRRKDVLLIERRNAPIGFAPPAGHVDNLGTFEDAARIEVHQEVGLSVERLELVGEGKRMNPCRRIGGTWHYWKIYKADVSGELQLSNRETRSSIWASPETIRDLAGKTEKYAQKSIDETEWIAGPGLEPVWVEWFRELGLV